MAGRAPIVPSMAHPKSTESLPLEDQIRKRAHEIYLQRGGDTGSELDDWLEAEAEIRQQQEDQIMSTARAKHRK